MQLHTQVHQLHKMGTYAMDLLLDHLKVPQDLEILKQLKVDPVNLSDPKQSMILLQMSLHRDLYLQFFLHC